MIRELADFPGEHSRFYLGKPFDEALLSAVVSKVILHELFHVFEEEVYSKEVSHWENCVARPRSDTLGMAYCLAILAFGKIQSEASDENVYLTA